MPPRAAALLVSLLAALDLACHHRAQSSAPPSPAFTPTVPEVVEWLLGEQVRGPRTSNKGVYVGVVALDTAAAAQPARVVHPSSCAPELVQLLVPGRTGSWLAIDAFGQLLRHAEAGWSPVSSTVPMPPITKLIASAGAASRLELLVTLEGRSQELHLLTLVGDQLIGIQSLAPSTFHSRRDALERYDSGRCIAHVRDCLHLTAIDHDLVLMREPALFEPREEVTTLPRDAVRDVRYADAAGTQILVLSTEACVPEPSAQPEAAP